MDSAVNAGSVCRPMPKIRPIGMAVFVFDYRGFNDSEGEPRNYINPKRHLQDWDDSHWLM